MAINTGSLPGEQQDVYAKAPAFPDNLGKIDVGAIYDATQKALNQSQQLGQGARDALSQGTNLVNQVSAQPSLTQETKAKAAAGTAQAGVNAKVSNFLAGLPNPALTQYGAQGGLIGQTVNASRVYDTSDPKNPRLIDKEDTFITDPKTGQPTLVGSKQSAVFAPRDINTFKEHTDANGNIVTTTGTYRQLDVSKPAFLIDKEGNIAPILGKDGQPVNASLVGATGTAVRGTPVTGGAGGDATRLANLQNIVADHPESAPTLQPIIDALTADLKNQTNKTAAQGALDTAKATAVGAPKPGTPEYTQTRIDQLKTDIGQAASEGNTDLVKSLSDSLRGYQDILSAREQGISKKKPGLLDGLATAPSSVAAPAPSQPGSPDTAAPGTTPTIGANDRAAYDALPNGAQYIVNGTTFVKGQ